MEIRRNKKNYERFSIIIITMDIVQPISLSLVAYKSTSQLLIDLNN